METDTHGMGQDSSNSQSPIRVHAVIHCTPSHPHPIQVEVEVEVEVEVVIDRMFVYRCMYSIV